MKTIEVFVIIAQLLTAGMYLRSCFYILRVRKEMDRTIYISSLVILIMGTGLALYNLSEPEYVSQRFPFNSVINIASAYAFYLLTKSKKEDLYNISNILKREYSKDEKDLMSAINEDNSNGVEIVTAEMLDLMELNKIYSPSKKTQVKKMKPPKGVRFKFDAQMLKGGVFGRQRHPKLTEFIYIDYGAIKDISTGEIYRQGEVMQIPENAEHNPIALERTSLSAYLYEV